MSVRKMACALFLLALLAGSPLSAQLRQEYRFNADRPDAHAPIGVVGDHLVAKGDLQVSLRFTNRIYEGNNMGTDSIPVEDVLDTYSTVPTRWARRSVSLSGTFGITDGLSLLGIVELTDNSMDHLMPGQAQIGGTQQDVYFLYTTKSFGFEDVRLSALWGIYDEGAYRVLVSTGVSFPVGVVDYWDVTPLSDPKETYLPYPMQIGSGTWDVLPGFTAMVQNERASFGIQGAGVIRIGSNDREWTRGDEYTATMWGGYVLSDAASVSAGLRASTWGNIEGADRALDAFESPTANTLAQGGTRVDLSAGLNFLLPSGPLAGHRLGVEAMVPVYQSLDGPQLAHGWTVVVGWQKVF